MPRPVPPAPVVAPAHPIPMPVQRQLANLMGRESLPGQCADEIGTVLALYRKTRRLDRERKKVGKPLTTPGNVAALIEQVCDAMEELLAVDGGADTETRALLADDGKSFLEKARARIAELKGLSRVYPAEQPLLLVGPLLRRIFEAHAAPDFRDPFDAQTRFNMRHFAHLCLTGCGDPLPGIDAKHLDRLDPYLDGQAIF